MPEFTYTARSRDGQQVSDAIEAPNRQAAGQLLRDQGLLPTSLQEKKKSFFDLRNIKKSLGHVSLLEKLTFLKNLTVTIRSGMPVSKSLGVVSEQMSNAYFRNILQDIAHSVESGQSLSESMQKYPKIFSPIFTNMVAAGEQSGQLDGNLDYLSKQIGRDYYLIKRTKGALMYPAVVLTALVIIGYIMFVFVLPRLTETFKEFSVELPFLTKMIISVVDIISSYAPVITVLILALLAGLWMWIKTEPGRLVWDTIILHVPLIGSLVKKINLARFSIVFSGLLKSGLPIVEALAVTADTLGNVNYRNAVKDFSERVKIGVSLQASLMKYPKLFTPMVTQMVLVGEESGTMEDTLAEVANFYESEVDDSVKNLSSIIEPVLVVVIGAVVAVLAVGLILPIYNISSTI